MNKVKNISHQEFLASFKNVPRVAISLIIENKKGEVLLAKRNISPCKNCWHLVGSFLIKKEKLEDCIARILESELGHAKRVKKSKFVGVFEDLDKDPRGHVIELIYELVVDDLKFKGNKETKEVKFFDKLPINIGFNHRDILETLGFK